MKSNPVLSIIVPVYNSERYVYECVDSVLKQSYTDWELILIDDGSSDNSAEICKKIALSDKRIHCICKQNGGASSARNMGLNYAKGDWIIFLDIDDIILPQYIESFMAYREYDFVVGGFTKWSKNSNKIFNVETPEFYTISKMNYDLINCKSNDCHINVLYHICGKMFRKDIINSNNMRFDESMKLAEDTCFNIEYFCHCNTLCLICNSDYYYRETNSQGKYTMNYNSYSMHMNRFSLSLNLFYQHYSYRLDIIKKQIEIAFLNAINEYICSNNGTYHDFCNVKDKVRILSLLKLYSNYPRKRILVTIAYCIPSYLGYHLLRVGDRLSNYVKNNRN